MGKAKFLLLIFIFALAILGRFYKFNAPIADWHAWRQTDTSAVSVNFAEKGFDIFHPKFYDLSNVPSGIHENPEGYRFVEFPFYNIAQAGLFKLIGVLTIEQWGRLITIFSSFVSALFLYLIVKKYLDKKAGIFTSFFFLINPFNIFYSRVVLPDPMTTSITLGAIFFFDRWLDKNLKIGRDLLLALIFSIAAILLKPFALFFLIPMAYLAFYKFGFDFLKNKKLWVFGILAVAPFILWRFWMLQFPGGIPQSGWLLDGSGIRFKGAFFQWIFAERISKLILGYWGLPLLILGILLKLPRKSYFLFLSFLASSVLYLFVIATGNVQHDYYQILIMPTISIYLALGAWFLWENKANTYRLASISILLICTLFMISFGWHSIRDYYIVQHEELISGGKKIDSLIPKDAKVIVPDAIGDTTSLYFMKRQGWSSFSQSPPELIKMGADYMIFFNPEVSDYGFEEKYKISYSSSDLLIYDLHNQP